jgi:thioredoxin reductase (NADPH)
LEGGHFAILATGIDNLTIDNLVIDTDRDGMDVDCCRNVRVSNCTVNSPWDDAICPKSSDALGYVRSLRSVQTGEVLYRPGDLAVPLYVLLSTSVQIVQPDAEVERPVTVLYPGMFTGEAGMIGGQRAVVLARVTQPGEVLEVHPENLRLLVARDAQISEAFLRAFMLRRLMLITRQLGNVLILGSRHFTNTDRLREFLGRNGHPYT